MREYETLRTESIQRTASFPVTAGWLSVVFVFFAAATQAAKLPYPFVWIACATIAVLLAFWNRRRNQRFMLNRLNAQLVLLEQRINELATHAFGAETKLLTWETSLRSERSAS